MSRCYEPVTIGLDAKIVTAESGLCVKPQFTLRNAPRLDTLVIPGGAGMRDPKINGKVAIWIRSQARRLRRIAAVCTGVYGLAASGLLDGRRVSTHWRFARDLAQRYPAVTVDARLLFVKDGTFYTSAGITAGIDLALRVVERYFGSDVATQTAYDMEYQGQGWLDPNSNSIYAKIRTSANGHPLCAVCSMTVDATTAPTSTYKDTKYYFCSQDHKGQFDAAPETFVALIQNS